MPTTLTRMPLDPSLDAASQARSIVREALRGQPTEAIDRGLILVDELVASALVHVGAPVELVLERHVDRLVVEVLDCTLAGSEPVTARLGVAATMLDSWASEWGSVEQPAGSSIWFCLDLADGSAPPPEG